MPQPIAVAAGISFAFPDILQTPAGPTTVPVPYPNIAKLDEATGTAYSVKAGGKPVILKSSRISTSTGGEAGTGGPPPNQQCTFTSFSSTVFANGEAVVRQFDTTSQNNGNAVGQVMNGLSTVLVGG